MAERPASIALVMQQSSHLFFYWHSFVESATPKEMIFDQPEVTIAIINVQDYDLSDHQFVRLTLGAQKGISSEIVLVPRELVHLDP